ncbi:MAG TPA: type VI secretion system protein TssL, long form [Roseiarcus sp.]|jgi:type VI secretion system protein ImpK
MTDNDDPFGRRDRTIIRPNPGGRRPVAPPPGYPAPPPGGAPPSSTPTPPVSYPAPAYPPSPPPSGAANWDGWMTSPTPPASNPYLQQSAPIAPMTPAPVSPHVSVDLVTVAANPMMRAAASLLLLLGRLRASLSRVGAGQLMDQVAQAIQQFEIDARAAGVPADQVNVAKYALAACADDVVQNLPTDDRQIWTQYSMLVRFFSERTGGVKFFQELDRAKQNPALNLGLLEIMHACLSLGFEGVYRTGGGAGALQGIRRDLYETIRRATPKTIEDLSPHWRGQSIALASSRFQAPTWAISAVAGVLLLGVYLVLRNLLSGQAETVALAMAQVHPDTDITIAREVAVKPPPDPPARTSTQLERIRAALANEILAGKVGADQSATTIFIRIGSVVLFPSGGAQVNASFAPIAKKIAASLDKEPGAIRIDGYTDSDPIKTVAFPSNFELSEARAKSVAALLKSDLAKPDRIQVAGKGTENPVAPNDVEANKAKNRRVEISIPRAD